jgi:D-alanyl-D-alanine carboxypeptidase
MRIGMPVGESWPREQMLAALLMVSANDAAWALAECAGGDVAGFAAQGGALMRRLGATDGRFGDPAGLSDRSAYGGGSWLSPWDLAVLGRNALAVPAIAGPAGTVELRFTDVAGRSHRFVNHNATLLRGYPGANGLKTGFTDRAGRTLIASARRDGRTMLAVVFGTWDTAGWAGALLDRGFASRTDAPGLATLPPVRVRPARAEGPATCGAAVTGGSVGAATTGGSTADGTAVRRDATPTRAAARPFSARIPWRTLAIAAGAVLAVLAAVVLARRAVVLRRRRRRAARRRAVARAHRSGTIHVVDAVPPRPNADLRRTSRATRTGPGVTARSTRGDR